MPRCGWKFFPFLRYILVYLLLTGYVHVGTCRVSPDHRYLAYTLDITGSEWFKLQIKDLRTGCILPNLQAEGVVSLAWAQDSCTIFYTLADKNQRPFRVLCADIKATNNSDGMNVFTESDSGFCVDITATKDGQFITVNSNSRTSSEEGITCSSFSLDFGRHFVAYAKLISFFKNCAGLLDRCKETT